jgi:hypothetical protein
MIQIKGWEPHLSQLSMWVCSLLRITPPLMWLWESNYWRGKPSLPFPYQPSSIQSATLPPDCWPVLVNNMFQTMRSSTALWYRPSHHLIWLWPNVVMAYPSTEFHITFGPKLRTAMRSCLGDCPTSLSGLLHPHRFFFTLSFPLPQVTPAFLCFIIT